MEFMIAYYPLLKAGAIVFIMYIISLLISEHKNKMALALAIALVVLMFFTPFKIDGTKTKQHHKTTVSQERK